MKAHVAVSACLLLIGSLSVCDGKPGMKPEWIKNVVSMLPVKSIQEVKKITPIDDSVAEDAIQKWSLKNIADGNGEPSSYVGEPPIIDDTGAFTNEEVGPDSYEEESETAPAPGGDEEDPVLDLLKEEEEIEPILDEKIHEEEEKLGALNIVADKHAELRRKLQEMINNRDAGVSEIESLEEVKSITPIKSIEEVKSIQEIESIDEVKSIQPVKSIKEVKNLYRLTASQADELRRMISEPDKYADK